MHKFHFDLFGLVEKQNRLTDDTFVVGLATEELIFIAQAINETMHLMPETEMVERFGVTLNQAGTYRDTLVEILESGPR